MAPYLSIDDFKGGLDTRRMPETSPAGTLSEAVNVHITKGSEIETAKEPVDIGDFPAGTFGLASAGGQLYSFGSIAPPAGMPAAVEYVRLVHPDAAAMTKLLATDNVAGAVYALAQFADGKNYHFYDGDPIEDWFEGLVRASMTDLDGMADDLALRIDADDNYSASAAGAVVTITGEPGVVFLTTTGAVDGGGVDDQTATAVNTQEAADATDAASATASFRVTGGTAGTKNVIAQITVDGTTDLFASKVYWATSNSQTAADVATEINANTGDSGYTATSEGDKVTITAVATGTAENGKTLEVEAGQHSLTVTEGGDVTVGNEQTAPTQFDITAGTVGGGNQITQVRVRGINLLAAAVLFDTDNATTAEAVAEAINDNTSETGYKAKASGATVKIRAKRDTKASGNVEISDIVSFASGAEAAAALPQITTVTLAGTFDVGDQFTVTLADVVFGADRVTDIQATTIKVFANKMFAGCGPLLEFSGAGDVTGWHRHDAGSGFIDMSVQETALEAITGLGIFQKSLAVFGEEAILVWHFESDPDKSDREQNIPNMGTKSPRSIKAFGALDTAYLDSSGIRSLRLQGNGSSVTAGISDFGTPIDSLVKAKMAAVGDAVVRDACAEIEPIDGRYMLALDDTVFVFTFFYSEKITSWTKYEYGLSVEWWALKDKRVYFRANDKLYLLGGTNNDEYVSAEAFFVTGYVDGRREGNFKQWLGIDMSLQGVWKVEINTDPNRPDVYDTLGTFNKTTINELNAGVSEWGPVFKLKFTNAKPGEYAKLGSIMMHYELETENG